MNTADLKKLIDSLEVENGKLSKLIKNEAVLRLKGHQNHCSVTVNGISIDISYSDKSTGWLEKLISGRDMIQLGAIKAMQAMIDDQLNCIDALKADIKKATDYILEQQ